MVRIPGGSFSMGSEEFYPEERPVRRVPVDEFWIDRHPVINATFSRFVDDTGYVTVAERPVDPRDYPDADPALLVPGSAVFRATISANDPHPWWEYVPGASWRHPEGSGSDLDGRARHPVVHVAAQDAEAYADWAGKHLPTEAEWEYAARGGLDGARYAWGHELAPGGRAMANTWRGTFPWRYLAPGRGPGTTGVMSFPPNGYGLYDCIGNIWEWTSDSYGPPSAVGSCCGDSRGQHTGPPARVIKGGSFLCAPNYCRRYRPAARQPEPVDTSTCHLGFRCVVRDQTR
jgi:formylglycine-generating enzyme required for sulfatase activity